jgi:hypothetical protein
MAPEDARPDLPSTNWNRATMLIWEADNSELQLIIDVITEHERQTGSVIQPHELRARLQRPGA